MPVPLLKLCPQAESLTTDADLLARFAAERDEAAFTELVRRHGPVVYRVCRRLVPAEADDAFQAVFLVLACRGGSIRVPAAVGGWLVSVAGRVAWQMRAGGLRRAQRERVASRPEVQRPPPDTAGLGAVLDDELTRLPDDLRSPVVMCLIGGLTHAQAAADLGSSVRSLRRRLDRARAILRARLEARGVVPTVAAALIAGMGVAVGAAPPSLSRRTVALVFQFLDGAAPATPAVAAAKGVVAGMVKFKSSAVVASAAVLLVCLGFGWSQDRPAPPVPLKVAGSSSPAVVPPIAGVPDVSPSAPDWVRTDGVPSAKTANFEVHAPTPVMARAIAAEAEHQRRTQALKWLGKELPAWPTPCVVRFTPGFGGNGGASTFTFEKGAAGTGALKTASIDIRGDFLAALNTTLPHEVTHLVLASAAGRALPRCADEGMALLSEADDEQAEYDTRLRDMLGQGRGVRLKVLFPMAEYPQDVMALYAQGHSIARFLVARTGVPVLKDIPLVGGVFDPKNGHQRLLVFTLMGSKENTPASWNEAAKTVYGFASVDALEEAWLEWLARPESALRRPEGSPRPVAPAKPARPDLIPPLKLPGAGSETAVPFNRDLGDRR